MKILYCTSCIDETNIERYKTWSAYHGPKFPEYVLFMLNDGAVDKNTQKDLQKSFGIELMEMEPKLGRPAVDKHFGWWRSQYHMLNFFANNDYIQSMIHIESDAAVISNALVDYLKSTKTGWKSMWCPNYNMKESSIQVVNRDAKNLIYGLKPNLEDYNYVTPELFLPMEAEIRFKGRRWENEPIPVGIEDDFVCQIFDHPQSVFY